MKLFKAILIVLSSMLFMGFCGYAGGSEWGKPNMGWLLFSGGVIPMVFLLMIGYLDGESE